MPEENKFPRKEETSRSRDKNYTDRECLELIRTVKKYGHIIESRKYDAVGGYKYKNDDRNAAWDAVCREFNMKTSQNRTIASLKMKWKNDKSNIRDYIQYLKTSQSRSGRAPDEIPKPKFMNLIAEVIGADCAALGPVPDVDELCLDMPESPMNTVKQEPPVDNTDLTFEQIMVNENSDQFNYNVEDTSSIDSFHENAPRNQNFHPPPPKRTKLSNQIPPSFQSNGISHPTLGIPATTNNSSDIHELQIQLLKRQIEVQELMASELKAKIERTQQLMKLDMAESELRCKEIAKRLDS